MRRYGFSLMKVVVCMAYEASSQRIRAGHQWCRHALHCRVSVGVHRDQSRHLRRAEQVRGGDRWATGQRRRGFVLLPQQDPRWHSGQLHQFLARHPKIVHPHRGGDQASGPGPLSPLLRLKHRLLPHVLQMGDLPATPSILHENLPSPLRHLPSHLEQLLRFLPVHPGSHNPEVLQEVQEDGFRGDDDLPAEHADQGVDRRGPGYCNCRGIRIPELLCEVMLSTWSEHIKIRGLGSSRRRSWPSSRTCGSDSRCSLGIAWTYGNAASRRLRFTIWMGVLRMVRSLGSPCAACWRCFWWICGCGMGRLFAIGAFRCLFRGRSWGWKGYRLGSRLGFTVLATWTATREQTCGRHFTWFQFH